MAPSRRAPAASQRLSAVHVPPRSAAIRARRRRVWNPPNPSRPGESNPLPTYPQPEEKREKRRRRSRERRRHRGAVPTTPELPARRSRSRRNAYVLYFLFLLDAARPHRTATSTSAASFLVSAPPTFTDAPPLRPVAT